MHAEIMLYYNPSTLYRVIVSVDPRPARPRPWQLAGPAWIRTNWLDTGNKIALFAHPLKLHYLHTHYLSHFCSKILNSKFLWARNIDMEKYWLRFVIEYSRVIVNNVALEMDDVNPKLCRRPCSPFSLVIAVEIHHLSYFFFSTWIVVH